MGIMVATPNTAGVQLGTRRPTGGGGITSWSIPPIAGFNRGIYRPKMTPRQFRGLMGLAIWAGRRGLPGLGDPNLPSTWGTPGPGCVPLGDGTCQTALYGPTPCMEVRECDSMTGALHFEYLLPTGAPSNTNISEVSPDSGKVVGYSTGPSLDNLTVGAGGPVPVGTQIVNPKTGALVYVAPAPTGGGSQTATPPAAAATGSGASVNVSLQNKSRPGQPLQVGDSWLLAIVGPPNASVINAASHNGVYIGATNYGKTDANGKFSLTGVMSPDTAGSWVETWNVGNSSARLSFSVANASGAAGGAAAGSGETGGGGATSTDTSGDVPNAPPAVAVPGFSFLGLSGTSLLIAAAVLIGGAMLLFGGKR